GRALGAGGLPLPPSKGRAGRGGRGGPRVGGACWPSPGIGPPTAALSAERGPGAADKSKPPPRRRENQGIRAASLDHLNDPLPRGFSADSGGMSSLATGLLAHRG